MMCLISPSCVTWVLLDKRSSICNTALYHFVYISRVETEICYANMLVSTVDRHVVSHRILSGFFSLNFWWGGLKIFRPRQSPTGTKSDGGGDFQKNLTEAETAYLMQN